MEPWLTVLQTFGLATMLLVAIGAAAWRSLVWFGREIIIPGRDRFLARTETFFDNLMQTQAHIKESQQALLGVVQDVVERQETFDERQKELIAVIEALDGRRVQQRRRRNPPQDTPPQQFPE